MIPGVGIGGGAGGRRLRPGLTVAGPASSLAFASDWGTATGQTDSALRDGSKWENLTVFDRQILEVVSASGLGFPSGMTNALRVEFDGEQAAHVSLAENGSSNANTPWGVPGTGEGLYFRVYFRNSIPDGDGAQDVGSAHQLQPAWGGCATHWAWKFGSNANGTWGMIFNTDGAGGGTWYGLSTLSKNHTYRLEWGLYNKTAGGAYTLELRIYNESGTQVIDGTDFEDQGSYGGGGGTMASQAPIQVSVSDDCIRRLFVGNNGPLGWDAGPGSYQYFGGMAVSETDWIGAYSAGEGE